MTDKHDALVAAAFAFAEDIDTRGVNVTSLCREFLDAAEPFRTKPARVGRVLDKVDGVYYENNSYEAVERTDLVNKCLTGCVLDEDELLTAFDPTTDKIEMVDQSIEACHAKMKGGIQDE